MTQKGGLFKGQHKKDSASNRHGKAIHIRKGKVFKKPTKNTEDFETSKEVAKFIDQANEAKAAAIACKEGAQLKLIQAPAEAAKSSKRSKALFSKKKQ